MSKVIRLSALNGRTNDSHLLAAKHVLTSGQVIGLPTDTIYGLAVSVLNTAAIKRLYQLKTRDESKPIAICVADIDQIGKWCDTTVGSHVLHDLLPGAVTLVFNRSDGLNANLNPGHELVGVRIPDHNFIRDLCRLCGPLGLTSANLSSEASCLNVDEFQHLWPELAAVFDGGPLAVSLGYANPS
ncbi:unnamed protein product [Medioppia subpectinata]|uniref:Threonylcarbamoyl-AMP synthase n=1 Tax=Medioppia subpectinata TaxID=1979941 RepID=A0A7R9KDI8_9ACAR|nr:unnamed protein product [Medioppia subpectinata]CAG2100274.1 unnamed protein product [Medioppia subpectinata]